MRFQISFEATGPDEDGTAEKLRQLIECALDQIFDNHPAEPYVTVEVKPQ